MKRIYSSFKKGEQMQNRGFVIQNNLS